MFVFFLKIVDYNSFFTQLEKEFDTFVFKTFVSVNQIKFYFKWSKKGLKVLSFSSESNLFISFKKAPMELMKNDSTLNKITLILRLKHI